MNSTLPRLLLVEDDPVSRVFLQVALEALPAEVMAVPDGVSAREAMNEGEWALWLLDANLPDTAGETLLGELRASFPGVCRGLALTADTSPERHASLRGAGFIDVLIKPLSADLLRLRVRQLLDDGATLADGRQTSWNEEQALAAAGGRWDTVRALRELFLNELPGQRQRVETAIARGDLAQACAVLHQLKASCGFVGADRLLEAVRTLHGEPGDAQARARFDAACEAVLREAR